MCVCARYADMICHGFRLNMHGFETFFLSAQAI